MAKVNAKDIPIEQQMFSDVWEIYKNYHEVEISEQYMDNLTRDIKGTFAKYKEFSFAPFTEKMLLGMLDLFNEQVTALNTKQRIESYGNK